MQPDSQVHVRAIQFKKREREDSSDEEDISLRELQRRKKLQIMDDQHYNDEQDQVVESGSDENPELEQSEYNDYIPQTYHQTKIWNFLK